MGEDNPDCVCRWSGSHPLEFGDDVAIAQASYNMFILTVLHHGQSKGRRAVRDVLHSKLREYQCAEARGWTLETITVVATSKLVRVFVVLNFSPTNAII